jgi:dipeptidyl aminopeptidase/acylaminoacyl peptidase
MKRAWLLLLVMSFAVGRVGAEAGRHPLTLNDLLTAGNTGFTIEIDPSGRRIAFEYMPSYIRQASFGVVNAEGFERSGDLYLYDLEGTSPPRPLFTRDGSGNPLLRSISGVSLSAVSGAWSGGFSPAGSRLVVYLREGDATRVGMFDIHANRLVVSAVTPDLPYLPIANAQRPLIWLSEDELVLATLPAGRLAVGSDQRQAPARQRAQAWEDAWRGEKPTVSVLYSPAGEPDRTMQAGTLVRIDARTGKLRPLATGRFEDMKLSPDGRFLAAMQTGAPRQANPDRLLTSATNMYRQVAVLFDLSRPGPPVAMAPGFEAAPATLAWSETSDRVTFYARRDGAPEESGNYQFFDVGRRSREEISHPGLEPTMRQPKYLGLPDQGVPFGDGLVLAARASAGAGERASGPPASAPAGPEAAGRVDWFLVHADGRSRNLTAQLANVLPGFATAAADALFVQAQGGIWRIPATGAPENLTSAINDPLTNVTRVRNWLVAQTGGAKPGFLTIDLRTHRVTAFSTSANVGGTFSEGRIAAWTESGRLMAFSPEAQRAIFRVNGYAPWTLSVVGPNGFAKNIWTYNEPFARLQSPRRLVLRYPYRGKELVAQVLLPIDWVPGRRSPAVVDIYPGNLRVPASWDVSNLARGGIFPGWDLNFLVSMGFIVVEHLQAPPDLLRDEDNPSGHWADVVLPALDALVEQGYADPDRIALHGASQGSWSALSLVTQTNRFTAAIAAFGLSDFISGYGTWGNFRMWPDDFGVNAQIGRYEAGGYPDMRGAPWDKPDAYVKASPLFAVRRINTPLMLIHTDQDGFPMDQFEEMFTALTRLRKEAQYVRYWGEGHGLSSPANIRDQWARIFSWYDKWCDITRDDVGRIVYDGDRPKSRNGAPEWTRERFLKLESFFGPEPARVRKH